MMDDKMIYSLDPGRFSKEGIADIDCLFRFGWRNFSEILLLSCCTICNIFLWPSHYHTQCNGLAFNENCSDILTFGKTLPWYSIYLQIIHNKMALPFPGVNTRSKGKIVKLWR